MDRSVIKALNFEKRDTEHYEYPRLCIFQDTFDFENFKTQLRSPSPSCSAVNNCLYIHIPFCSTICTFCNYFKVIDKGLEEKDLFVEALVAEIAAYGRFLHDDKKKISGIHFGGGTPSLLNANQFSKIMNALGNSFDMSECEVYSLEGTLKSLVEPGKISTLVEVGFNRVSFGVQTLNQEIRKKMGVKYEQDQLYELCTNLPKLGFENYNVDLMYNLPRQQPEEVLNSIDELFSLGVNNIDLYFLNVYPKTNMENMMKKKDMWNEYNEAERQLEFGSKIYNKIAEEKDVKLIFSNTISKKSEAVQCTLSNALGNNRYNGGNQISIGPSSRGFFDGYIYKNESSLDGYISRVKDNGFGYFIGRKISEFEAGERTMVMFPNFIRVRKEHVRGIERHREKIDYLVSAGILTETEDDLSVNSPYSFFGGNISAFFQSKEEKQRAMKSYFLTRSKRLNFYNQDKTNIAKVRQ